MSEMNLEAPPSGPGNLDWGADLVRLLEVAAATAKATRAAKEGGAPGKGVLRNPREPQS